MTKGQFLEISRICKERNIKYDHSDVETFISRYKRRSDKSAFTCPLPVYYRGYYLNKRLHYED